MLERFFDYVAHVVVRKLVENVLTDLTVLYKTILPQNLELMGYSRLCHTESRGNITHAHRGTVNGE
jgi:hypothetical protein